MGRDEVAEPCDCAPIEELQRHAARKMGRRKVLTQAAAAGAIVWVAPTVIGVSPAAAAGSTPVVKTGTSSLWKWNSSPPNATTTCTTGTSGNANRGSVEFQLTCSSTPQTVSASIIVTSGPALSGGNQRSVTLLQSNSSGCLSQTTVGTFNSANNVTVQMGSATLTAGATHFSLIMLQTGGGGTDTYTTNRVALSC